MTFPRFNIPSWVRWVFSIAVMALIFTQVDFSSFTGTVMSANPLWLLLGLVMIFFETVAVAVAWRAMIRTKGYSPPFFTMLHIMLTANFLGFVLPSSMGSDIVKVVGLSKYIGNAAEALSSLLLFRVIGYGVLFLIAFIAATLFSGYLPDEPFVKGISIFLVIGCLVAAVGIIFMKPAFGLLKWLLLSVNLGSLFEKLKKVHDALFLYLGHPVAMAKAVAGAIFMQIDRIVYVFVIALALGIEVEPVTLCLFVPLITALTVIPISVSGIGVREGGYVFLFGYAGLSAGEALSLSLCGFALDIVFVLLGGVIYLLFGFPENEGLQDPDKLEKLITED
ncbi:hypothetical protein MNBD_NITROSPINAE02-1379 [hydrothermal vent metagenome]|uniref:Flippase-like domain-containing protein n=1 Tax=hydrothermal vent metagenome TaxID=652676 RepID=A0A3B1BPY4_9ZZZZ